MNTALNISKLIKSTVISIGLNKKESTFIKKYENSIGNYIV